MTIALDAALRTTAKSWRSAVAPLWPILLRLLLIALFCWYLVEFVLFLAGRKQWFSAAVLGAVVLAVGVLLGHAGRSWRKQYNDTPKDADLPVPPVRPYIYAVLLPVLAVLISTVWNVRYSTPLLEFTRKIVEVLSL